MELARVAKHAEIKCDGATCGRLVHWVIDPKSRELLALVIRLPDGRLKLLEACRVCEAHVQWVHVALTLEQLEALPDYRSTDFSLPSADWPAPAGLAHPDILWPSHWAPTLTEDVSPGPLPIEHVNLPPEVMDVAAGSRVYCSDQECGEVSDLLYDPDDETARAFVVRRGFLWTHDVEVPLGWIDHVDERGVHLKMTSRQVEELGRFFPPER